MIKTKKNVLNADETSMAPTTDTKLSRTGTSKFGKSKTTKIAPSKADAAMSPLTATQPPCATSAMKASKADTKYKMSMAKTADALRPAKSAGSEAEKIEAAQKESVRVKTTKQEKVPTMLFKSGGASIDEMIVVTGWQQHSVRGFLAGTVRKKLGLDVASVKAAGGERRYAIKPHTDRGR